MSGARRLVKEYCKKYMELYIQGQALFAEYNPCEPHADGSCMRTRFDPSYERKFGERCCGGCKFHSAEEGCKTIALSCKLWVCSRITSLAFSGEHPRLREFYDKLHVLKEQMGKLDVYPGCRTSMSESIEILRKYVANYLLLERSKAHVADKQWKEEAQAPRYQEERA